LSLAEIEQIVGLQIQELQHRLAVRGLSLEMTPEARKFVAEAAYDPVYGVRPLKRYLQHNLETRIGRALIASKVSEGGRIEVGVDDDELIVTFREPKER
jgi:ATP-dependent Clp protease ATP-binding subunit ClpB